MPVDGGEAGYGGNSSHAGARERVAGPTEFGEMVPAVTGTVIWVVLLINDMTGRHLLKADPGLGFETVWILLITLPLGAWTLLMRLRWNDTTMAMTIGPWRREVALSELESIRWKMTGAWRSRGTIFVRDRSGRTMPIYVGRFHRAEEWGPVLLSAANTCNATVDAHARSILTPHRH